MLTGVRSGKMARFEGKTVEQAKAAAAIQLGCTVDKLTFKLIQAPKKGWLGLFRKPAIIEATEPTTLSVIKSDHKPVQTPLKPSSRDEVETVQSLTDKEREQLENKRHYEANLAKMKTESLALVDYLIDVFKQLGVEVQPQITQQTVHDLKIDLTTAEPGKVVGYHGRRLNAMEIVATTFLIYRGVKDPQVWLNVGDYRERRKRALTKLGQQSVTRVIASHQAVFLDPMPARERKFLHQMLEKEPLVKTYSHGREPHRSIVIAPK